MNTKRDYRSYDFILALLVITLAVMGIILIGSATGITTAETLPKEFTGQIIWVVTGVIIMIVASLIDFKFICKFYIPIYILNIVLLIAVLIYCHYFDPDHPEVYRSIKLPGGIGSIQPSEFNKIFMIIFLAKLIDQFKEKVNNIVFLLAVGFLTALPVILIMIEPSLSASLVTAVIMAAALYIAKLHYRYILLALALIVPLTAVIFYDVGNAIVERVPYGDDVIITVRYDENSMSPILTDKILDEYQIERLKSFSDPQPGEDGSYQNNQALLALGSGQLSGKGLFQGEVFVPEAANDFIFTVLGEEFGFAGCAAVIALIFLIVFRCIVIAMRSDIFYGKLIAGSFGAMLTFQTFCNVGVTAGLLPNTGMIFPFISSGGSAMWVFMALTGMVINIGMTKIKPMFAD